MPKVIVAVSNDLLTDQRVRKVSKTIGEMGFEVLTVGRRKKNSSLGLNYPNPVKLFRLPFETGALFYATFNIRLFLFLIFSRFDVVHSNDLDTLLACYWAAKIKRKKLVYDTHEYFTEVPELVNRPKIQKIWEKIEESIFLHLKQVITVNESIADLYFKKYGIKPAVLRNVPEPIQQFISKPKPNDKFTIVLQGNGINVDRGAEEMVLAMELLKNAQLHIIGQGDVIDVLKKMVNDLNLKDRVTFFGRLPYNEMMAITQQADLGVTLDKSTNINYLYSLPNKLFDYIQAGIPVLSSALPEIERIIRSYQCGITIQNVSPDEIAQAISELQNNPLQLEVMKANAIKAAQELHWENEKKVLLGIYQSLN